MKRKILSSILGFSLLIGSYSLYAAEVTAPSAQDINNPFNEELQINFDTTETGKPNEPQLTLSTNEIILVLDSKSAKVNGQEQVLVSPPKVIAGRTFLPLRFVADYVLGADINWNNATREVTVSKGGNVVIVKIGDKWANVNGEKVQIDSPPVISNGVTLLPVRFMSETFGIITSYNETNRTITLTANSQSGGGITDIRPVAQFGFDRASYIAGQIVTAIDTSYDSFGGQITERSWMINGDSKLTAPRLENIFKTPREGLYKISLRVRTSKGVWSAWTDSMLLIEPNQKPEVTDLMADKDRYAQGETMRFTYNYQNEEWENIKSERWTYRRIDEPISRAVIDKPKALFAEGDYIITLQLEDAYGNISDRKEKIIQVTNEVKRTELDYRFKDGAIGDIIDNFRRFNYQNYQEVFPYATSTVQGKLIMSDSPEVVKRAGILYKEKVNGLGKILMHHINDFEGSEPNNKRLVLVAENTTDKPVRILVENKTIKGPSEDTLYIGQLLLFDYFKGGGYEEYLLKPGEKKYIYDSVGRRWLKGQCISGLMDVITDGETVFTVAAVEEQSTIDSIANMMFLDKDIHPRGTFEATDIYYKVSLGDGEAEKLIIGKGSSEWINGYDAITGELVQNRGNFGISYHIQVTAKQDMGIILNPRGNIFRGAVKWEGENTYMIPAKGFFGGDTTKAVVLGTIKAGETKEFEYMLPNGSSAPVLIGFIPKKDW